MRHFMASSGRGRWVLPLGTLVLLSLGCPTGDDDDDSAAPDGCDEGLVDDGGECVPEACGVGTWGDLDVGPGTVFVDRAESGGDGSQDHPVDTIQAGLDLAAGGGGTRVVVAAGTYVENVELGPEHAGLELSGRCREMVILDGSAAEYDAAYHQETATGAAANSLSGFTITGATDVGIWVDAGELMVTRCDLVENVGVGIVSKFDGTHVVLQDVDVRDTQYDSNGEYGFGIQVSTGAALTASGCLLERNARAGFLIAHGGTEVDLTDVVVRETLPNEFQEVGFGVTVADGATAVASGLVVEDSLGTGIAIYGSGSHLELMGGEVSSTAYAEAAVGGVGINVFEGGAVTATGTLLEDNLVAAVMVQDAGSSGLLDGIEIRRNQGLEAWTLAAVVASEGAVVEAHDILVEQNTGLGAFVDGAGTLLVFQGGTIQDNTYDPDAEVGGGIFATAGARVEADGLQVLRNEGAGMDLLHAGTTAALTGVTLADTLPEPGGASGQAISVLDGASLVADGCVLQGNTWAGLVVFESGSEAILTDVTIEGTLPDASDAGGVGIEVAGGATLMATGGTIRGNHRVGLGAFDPGTLVELDGVTIEDTLPAGAAAGQGGYGVQVAESASAVLTDCTVQRNTRSGVAAFADTTLSITGGTVRDQLPDDYGEYGRGIYASDGASVTLTDVVLENNTEIGIQLLDNDTHATLTGVEIRGTMRGPQSTSAIGLITSVDADIEAQDLFVHDTEGPGIYVTSLASLDCSGCVLEDNSFAGLVVRNSAVVFDGGTIRGTVPDATAGGGVGIFADDHQGEPELLLLGTTVEPHPLAAVWIDGPGSYELMGNEIHGGPRALLPPGGLPAHGDAVYARGVVTPWDGGQGLSLQDNALLDAEGAGLFLDGATAALSGNTYGGNEIDVVQQRCTDAVPPTGLGEAGTTDLCPGYDQITAPLGFQLYLEEIDAYE